MTNAYELLKEGPQTGIHKSDLSFEERADLRQITVLGTRGYLRSNTNNRFTSVSYLAGDECAAASLFVEENRDLLKKIDFSKSNSVQRGVTREIYDWILHELGVRVLEKCPRVVREDRPEECVTWIIAREKFENVPGRRYSTGGTGSAKVEGISIEQVFEDLPSNCTLSDLPEEVKGHLPWIFAYFEESPEFDCKITPTEDSVSLTKRE